MTVRLKTLGSLAILPADARWTWQLAVGVGGPNAVQFAALRPRFTGGSGRRAAFQGYLSRAVENPKPASDFLFRGLVCTTIEVNPNASSSPASG